MGTPAFAVPALRAVAERCDVLEVVTQPDRPSGRGLAPRPSAVAEAAAELGLPIAKPERPKDDAVRAHLASLAPDLIAVVAFGAILTPALLAVPKLGAINLHGSLLPDYRGASPVQRALWDGRAVSGVTTLWMDDGIDTGDWILRREEAIRDDDDAGTLAARLAAIGAPLLAESLELATAGRAPRHPQDRVAGSYAKKLVKTDGYVDWTLDARVVWCHQRAVTPWPGATTAFRGRRVRLERTRPLARAAGASPGTVAGVEADGVAVACGEGALCIVELKPEGRGVLNAADWARGVRLVDGDAFESVKEISA
ncbi:MAG TPA: methionyl-tRNA formyltransferase [Candidatus Saccharimonadaceae bacterium]|jgi:methionyl-tRNA formyltransferase|nr:methionyl-tRNA formyltransferase [Candidatus Saccharimonadaceae bacterium]